VLDTRFISSLIKAQTITVRRGTEEREIKIPSDMMNRLLKAEEGFGSLSIPFVVDSVFASGSANGVLRRGDHVLGVDSVTHTDVTAVLDALQSKKGKEVRLLVSREGNTFEQTIQLDTAGRMGVSLQDVEDIYPIQHVSYNILSAVPAGIDRAVQTTSSYVGGLKYMFTKEGAKQMGGLGTMGKLFPSSFDWQSFWSITAFLSIILAVMNILPIPALDGGHILFIIVEMIRRKPLSDKAMTTIQTIGLILLVLLMLYANGNDIYRAFFK
jgi:membrane-associated zinc metalloprotease